MSDIDRIEIETSDREAVRVMLSEATGMQDLSDLEMELLLYLCRKKRKFGEKIEVPVGVDPASLGVRPGNGRFVINIQSASLLAAAVTLDILLTSGVATAALSALGKNPQAVMLLDEKSGTLCQFITVEGMRDQIPVSSDDINSATFGAKCRHSEFDCIHRINGNCCITEKAVENNLTTLSKGSVIELSNVGLVISVCK